MFKRRSKIFLSTCPWRDFDFKQSVDGWKSREWTAFSSTTPASSSAGSPWPSATISRHPDYFPFWSSIDVVLVDPDFFITDGIQRLFLGGSMTFFQDVFWAFSWLIMIFVDAEYEHSHNLESTQPATAAIFGHNCADLASLNELTNATIASGSLSKFWLSRSIIRWRRQSYKTLKLGKWKWYIFSFADLSASSMSSITSDLANATLASGEFIRCVRYVLRFTFHQTIFKWYIYYWFSFLEKLLFYRRLSHCACQ